MKNFLLYVILYLYKKFGKSRSKERCLYGSFIIIMIKNNENITENTIEGRNAVIEALKSGRVIDKLFLLNEKNENSGPLSYISAIALENNVTIINCNRKRLDLMSETHAHQGVIAICAARQYSTLDDIFALAESKNEPPFIVLCNGITDPHNLGAIIRSAVFFGVHGVIIPKNRNVLLTATVAKASSGAIEHLPICKVVNISSTIKTLKEHGVWVYAADGNGETSITACNLTGSIAIVIGAEGEGVSKLVKENCDGTIKIPVLNNMSSLNASNAAAVILYEKFRQTLEIKQ